MAVARIELLSGGTGRLIETKRTNGLFIVGLSTAASCSGQARNWNWIFCGDDSKTDALLGASSSNVADNNHMVNLLFLPRCKKVFYFHFVVCCCSEICASPPQQCLHNMIF